MRLPLGWSGASAFPPAWVILYPTFTVSNPPHDAIFMLVFDLILFKLPFPCQNFHYLFLSKFYHHYAPTMPLRGMPISTLKGSWKRLVDDERLRRSSQVISVIDSNVYIFGGELKPREPIDDKVHIFPLKSSMPPLTLASHQGTALRLPQMRQVWKQNLHLRRLSPGLGVPPLFSVGRCTSSLGAVALTWPL